MEATLLLCLQKYGFMNAREARETLKATIGVDVTPEAFEALRQKINRQLEFADFEIRLMTSPLDQQQYIAFVNKLQNDFITESLARKHPTSWPEFFKHIMVQILSSEEDMDRGGSLNEADIMRIGRGSFPGVEGTLELSVDECKEAIAAFDKEGWIQLHPHRPYHYTLGVRAFLEFHDEILEFDLPTETRAVLEKYM